MRSIEEHARRDNHNHLCLLTRTSLTKEIGQTVPSERHSTKCQPNALTRDLVSTAISKVAVKEKERKKDKVQEETYRYPVKQPRHPKRVSPFSPNPESFGLIPDSRSKFSRRTQLGIKILISTGQGSGEAKKFSRLPRSFGGWASRKGQLLV
jgi:hypothetical protein